MPDLYSLQPIFTRIQIGVGAWAWGDRLFWGFGSDYDFPQIEQAFDSSLSAGVSFFDTAETYGQGASEQILGLLASQTDQEIIVATKFMPFPWRLRRASLIKAIKASLARLRRDSVDLYQVHWPSPPVAIETWMKSMAEAVQQGLTRFVGVSNYSTAQMMRAAEALDREGIPLASNQVEFSLINRKIEKNGLLATCQRQGIALIAYSPLAQGLLTGKYTPENLPAGVRGLQNPSRKLLRLRPLLTALKEMGLAHGEKTSSQVALNWIICKGAIPIPGAKNADQAAQNAGALGWSLAPEEVSELDRLSDEIEG